MTIDDLLKAIYCSKVGTISTKIHTAYHGNVGGAGDYCIVTLTVGSDEFKFKSTKNGSWEYIA